MDMEIVEIDPEYEAKMIGFQIDCLDGKGDKDACHHVGEYYSVAKQDYITASKVYEENCSRNYALSCFNLARLYYQGNGVAESFKKGDELIEKSCRLGHNLSCYYYAADKYNKFVSPKNNIKTTKAGESFQDIVKLLERSCGRGEANSCELIGRHYIDMKNKERNPFKAKTFLERACDANQASACFNLAVMYKQGDVGISPDYALFEKYKLKTEEIRKADSTGAQNSNE